MRGQNNWIAKDGLHQGQVPRIPCFCETCMSHLPDREYNQKLYPRTRDVSSPLPEDINNNSIDMSLLNRVLCVVTYPTCFTGPRVIRALCPCTDHIRR